MFAHKSLLQVATHSPAAESDIFRHSVWIIQGTEAVRSRGVHRPTREEKTPLSKSSSSAGRRCKRGVGGQLRTVPSHLVEQQLKLWNISVEQSGSASRAAEALGAGGTRLQPAPTRQQALPLPPWLCTLSAPSPMAFEFPVPNTAPKSLLGPRNESSTS